MSLPYSRPGLISKTDILSFDPTTIPIGKVKLTFSPLTTILIGKTDILPQLLFLLVKNNPPAQHRSKPLGQLPIISILIFTYRAQLINNL
jgi:hypothetical protein